LAASETSWEKQHDSISRNHLKENYVMQKDNKFIQLAAVQFKLNSDDFTQSANFKTKINAIMADTKTKIDPRYNTLVVFPEDIGTMLVLDEMGDVINHSHTLNEGIEKSIRRHIISIGIRKLVYRTSWSRTFFLYKSQSMAKTYFETFSEAAQKYGVYIVAGSIVLPDYKIINGKHVSSKPCDNKVYNISYLFGPDGLIIGRQKKVYLIDLEGPKGLDLQPAKLSELKVFNTPMGNIGIAICLDAFKEDVLNALKKQAADILVQPSANPGQWTYEQREDWLNGSWHAVARQKMFKYAINPMMTGSTLDVQFYGQSSIVASDRPTPGTNYFELNNTYGFVSLSKNFDDEEIIIAKVCAP
jgi:predicted amidohydrolase